MRNSGFNDYNLLPVIFTIVGLVPHFCSFVDVEHFLLLTLSQQQFGKIFSPDLQISVQWAAVTNTMGPGGLLLSQS